MSDVFKVAKVTMVRAFLADISWLLQVESNTLSIWAPQKLLAKNETMKRSHVSIQLKEDKHAVQVRNKLNCCLSDCLAGPQRQFLIFSYFFAHRMFQILQRTAC